MSEKLSQRRQAIRRMLPPGNQTTTHSDVIELARYGLRPMILEGITNVDPAVIKQYYYDCHRCGSPRGPFRRNPREFTACPQTSVTSALFYICWQRLGSTESLANRLLSAYSTYLRHSGDGRTIDINQAWALITLIEQEPILHLSECSNCKVPVIARISARVHYCDRCSRRKSRPQDNSLEQ